MGSDDVVRLPKEHVPTPKLPQRLLDLARVIRDTEQTTKWYIHAFVGDEYMTAVLGSFRSREAADEIFEEFARQSGARATAQVSLGLWLIQYHTTTVHVVVSIIENVMELKDTTVCNWCLAHPKYVVKPFEEFKQAVLNPAKKKPTA